VKKEYCVVSPRVESSICLISKHSRIERLTALQIEGRFLCRQYEEFGLDDLHEIMTEPATGGPVPSVTNGQVISLEGFAGYDPSGLFAGCGESLIQIRENVIDMLDADAQSDKIRCNPCGALLHFVQLGVCGGCRMNRQRLGITHVGEM
jgi:hypothetical protein